MRISEPDIKGYSTGIMRRGITSHYTISRISIPILLSIIFAKGISQFKGDFVSL